MDKGASPDGDRAVVNGAASVSAVPASVPSAAWFTIDGHFGANVRLANVGDCDMVLVCIDKYQHLPEFICLPHQVYLERLDELLDEHEALSVTIMPYRNDLKVTIGYREIAQAIEARRAETGTGSVHESAVAKPCAQNTPGEPQ